MKRAGDISPVKITKKRSRVKIQTRNNSYITASEENRTKYEQRLLLLKANKLELKPEFINDAKTQEDISRARMEDEIYQTSWKKIITISELENDPENFPNNVLSLDTKILADERNFRLVLNQLNIFRICAHIHFKT